MVVWIALVSLISGCASQELAAKPATVSGLQPGDDIVPWNPIHVSGPNAGTNACPVCTYGERPAVVIFTRDGADVPRLAEKLNAVIAWEKARELKGFLIVLGATPEKLRQTANAIHAGNIGICYPDPATIASDLRAYKINPAAQNTVMLYANYKVTSNFVDLSPDRFDEVTEAISRLH
jgi:hypothetical protein